MASMLGRRLLFWFLVAVLVTGVAWGLFVLLSVVR